MCNLDKKAQNFTSNQIFCLRLKLLGSSIVEGYITEPVESSEVGALWSLLSMPVNTESLVTSEISVQ